MTGGDWPRAGPFTPAFAAGGIMLRCEIRDRQQHCNRRLVPAGRLQPVSRMAGSNPRFKPAGTVAVSCNTRRIFALLLRHHISGVPVEEKKCRTSARGDGVALPSGRAEFIRQGCQHHTAGGTIVGASESVVAIDKAGNPAAMLREMLERAAQTPRPLPL